MFLVMIHTVIIWTKITEACIILTVLFIFITDVISNNKLILITLAGVVKTAEEC